MEPRPAGEIGTDPRIGGIDYLRGIMAIFIVVGHMHGGGTSLIFSPREFSRQAFTLSDFLNYHLLLLAVPVFFLISGYLFASKERNFGYLRSYLMRIGFLLLFWCSLLIAYWYFFFHQSISWPTSGGAMLAFFLSAGNTQYWFLASLPLMTIIAALASHMSRLHLLWLCTLSAFYMVVIPFIVKFTQDYYWLCMYWNPLNFIFYPFFAVAVVRYADSFAARRMTITGLFFFLSFSLAVIEWTYGKDILFFMSQGSALPFYSRGSLLFAAAGIFILALHPAVTAGPFIRFLSRHSLSLYCLHPFLMVPVQVGFVLLLGQGAAARYAAIPAVIVLCYGISILYHAAIKTLASMPGIA